MAKRKLSEAAVKFAKRMKMTVAKKRPSRSNLGLNQTGPEIKYVDIISSDATINLSTSAVDFVLLNGVSQGSDNTNRIGRKVTAKALEINAVFTGNIPTNVASTSDQAAMVRWWVIVDAQADGATPISTDVWSGSDFIVDHRNLNNTERFKILRTGEFVLGPQNGVGTAGSQMPSKYYLKCHIPLNDAIRYAGTSAAVTDIASGAYYLCYCADTLGQASGPSIKIGTRFKFIDE